MADFEEEYLDVLQNIEFAIISVYRQHAELLDHDVERALNTLIMAYQAEQQQRTPSPAALTALGQEVHDNVRSMCELRLGREALVKDGKRIKVPSFRSLSLAEIIACLKRIRKSVQTWSKQSGRQGYLRFVNEFIH